MTLELSGITKAYGGFELGPIDLTVEDEVLSVLGPSGCGKTTLLSAIAGIVAPDAGTVVLNGTDLTGRTPEKRGTVVVFQDGALFPHMTARENIRYTIPFRKRIVASATLFQKRIVRLAKTLDITNPLDQRAETLSARENIGYVLPYRERIEELAETLEITSILDQRADTLSGGERQRVALARALAADPAALLLDEPLANLDAPIKRRLRDELRELLSSLDIPVIYVTHDQREASSLGDRIVVMEDGAMHQLDTPAEVFAHPETPFVASFTGSVNLFRAEVVGTDSSLVLEWGEYAIETPTYEFERNDEVWFCIRPEYVVVPHDSTDHNNVFDASITRRIFEGDDYLIEVVPDGIDETVRIKLSPPVYTQLRLTDRDRIRVSLAKEAIHVLDAD